VEVGTEDAIRIQALRALVRAGAADAAYLKEQTGSAVPALRVAALHHLADADEKACAEVCRAILRDFARGTGATSGGEAFAVAAAADLGGKLGAWSDGSMASDLARAATRARDSAAFARRQGENETDIARCKISVSPPLLEVLLIECGRGAGPAAAELLIGILKDQKTVPGRSEAALALGAIGGKAAVEALLQGLTDPDGWLRFCCYLSLRRLAGQDYFADWVFSPSDLKPAIDKYRAWFAKNPP
jgi:HEAT repeat protein